MTSNALVTAGISLHNGAEYLPTALEAVLAQTYDSLEVVICDNSSTDETSEVARQFAARHSHGRHHRLQEVGGAAPNANRTLALLRGEYFCWVAHDDVLDPARIEHRVVQLRAAPPETAVWYTDVANVEEPGHALVRCSQIELRAAAAAVHALADPTRTGPVEQPSSLRS